MSRAADLIEQAISEGRIPRLSEGYPDVEKVLARHKQKIVKVTIESDHILIYTITAPLAVKIWRELQNNTGNEIEVGDEAKYMKPGGMGIVKVWEM